MGIGDWRLGNREQQEWFIFPMPDTQCQMPICNANLQSPIANPQSPIPNPQSPIPKS